MKRAHLEVNPSSISLPAAGPPTGDIVLMVGGLAFPAEGWNDFVVVVLEAWVSALVRLLRSASEHERVYFMEGPYAVDVSRVNGGLLLLRAVERPNREHAVVEVQARPLVKNAVMAADDVLTVCRSAAYRSPDVDRLEMALVALRKEVTDAPKRPA